MRGSAGILVGNVLYAASQFALLLALATRGTLSDVGVFALGLAVATPLQAGFGMRLRTVRVVTDPGRYQYKTYLQLAVLSGVLVVFTSALVAIALTRDLYVVLVAGALAIGKAIESVSETLYGELQRLNHLGDVSRLQGFKAIATLGSAVLTVLLPTTALSAALALCLAWLMHLAVSYIRLSRRTKPSSRSSVSPARREVAGLFREAWPLGLTSASTAALSAIPRLVTSWLMGAAALGVYALLAYPIVAITLVANSLGQASLATLSRAVSAEGSKRAAGVVGKQYALVAGLGVVAISAYVVLARPLLGSVAPMKEQAVWWTGVILLSAGTVNGFASIAYYALTSKGSFRAHPWINVTSALVGLPVLFLLALRYGLPGVALGQVCFELVKWFTTLALSARPSGLRRG